MEQAASRREKVALVTLTEGGGVELMGNKTLVENIKPQKEMIEFNANVGSHGSMDVFVKEAEPDTAEPGPGCLASLPPEVQELVLRELTGAACLALAAACPALRPALADHQQRLEREARRQLEVVRAGPATHLMDQVAAMADLLARLTTPGPLRLQLKQIICSRFPFKKTDDFFKNRDRPGGQIAVLCPERRDLTPLGFLLLARAEAVEQVLEVRLREPSLSGALTRICNTEAMSRLQWRLY